MAEKVATQGDTKRSKRADFPVNFGAINEANIDQLRKLNVSVFPVRYNAKFYDKVVATSQEVTQVQRTRAYRH